jgi:SAM-dependent methyltransferase
LDDFVLHNANFSPFPFPDNSFDIIVSTEVLEHLKAPFIALIEMVCLLKEGGLLVLTIPNYWNLRYRIKYLLTGNLQRPLWNDDQKRADYLFGSTPHITTLTYPTLKAVLTWEGCEGFALVSKRRFGWAYQLTTYPIYFLIRLYSLAAGFYREIEFFQMYSRRFSASIKKQRA